MFPHSYIQTEPGVQPPRSYKRSLATIMATVLLVVFVLVALPITANAKTIRTVPSEPANSIAASAIAFAGSTSKDHTAWYRYAHYTDAARQYVPQGAGFDTCRRVTRHIPNNDRINWFNNCSGTVRYVCMWAGVDNTMPQHDSSRNIGQHCKKSSKWKKVGSFSRKTLKGVALKPGDLLIAKLAWIITKMPMLLYT